MRFRHLPRWLPYAVAGAWLLLGWAWLVRGAAHPGAPYRGWAFDHHAYSDLLAMGGDRYFGGARPIPYLQDRIEYPPLLGLALWLPSLLSYRPAAYFTLGYAGLAACGLASVALLRRLPGTRPWWLAGTPALAYYAGLNWDLLPIALLLASLVALERGAHGRAGAAAALGASAKLFPAGLLPVGAAALAGGARLRELGRGALLFLAAFAVVNAPVAAAAPASWGWFWKFNTRRGAENSVWELLRMSRRLARLAEDAAFLNLVTGALVALAVAAAAAAAFRAGRRRDGSARDAVRLGTALVLVVWVGTNKVWSPQYALWAFAAGAVAAAPAWLFGVHALLAVADYHVAFETRASRGLVVFHDALYRGEEAVRTAGYVALAAWIALRLLRAARGAPAPPGPGAAASPAAA